MAGVAERLLQTHTATAPTIDFIVYFRVFNQDRSFYWRDWLKGLVSALARKLSLDISMGFNGKMRLVLLTEGYGCVCGLYDPCLRRDLFHLLEEVSSASHQHNYYLIINLITTVGMSMICQWISC